MPDPLDAVSPLDGRYAARTASLRPYVSEAALMRARLEVEIRYLFALADHPAIDLSLAPDVRDDLRALYEEFDATDARRIKAIETEGTAEPDRPATNHDVKAVEYHVRDAMRAAGIEAEQWVHFGLTSEDVSNLAYRLLIKGAIVDELQPALGTVHAAIVDLAEENRSLPMLARTHGQPATPTTLGKEMAVFAGRLGRAIDRIEDATAQLAGKLAGASGTYAAHVAAYPDVDWRALARDFITDLDLDVVEPVTQVNPGDDLAALFDALRGANQVLIDMDRDMWTYVSRDYLGQAAVGGETGSSTMPHKVNPIDFENSEGNLHKANSDLAFLAESLTTSRLQRDLTDSTVKRNIGVALAHCLLGYEKAADGLTTVVPNEERMREDLLAHPEVLGEAIQTILRREGHPDAYERVKDLTRGRGSLTEGDIRSLVETLDLDDDVGAELEALDPLSYVGLAAELADEAGADANRR